MKSKKHAAPSVPTAIHSVESNKLSGPADIENIDVMSFKSAESIEVEREDQYKNTLEQSVAASNKHVFLSWNDISFGVPKSKKDIKEAKSEKLVVIEIDESRMSLFEKHNRIQNNSTFGESSSGYGSRIGTGSSAYVSNYKSVEGSTNNAMG